MRTVRSGIRQSLSFKRNAEGGLYMKILYVVPETPFSGGGGIATYLAHAAAAMRSAGHEVFVFTWSFLESKSSLWSTPNFPFDFEKTQILNIEAAKVWRDFPAGPWGLALSYYLAPRIAEFVRLVRPDVIETSDYQAPMFGYLMNLRLGRMPDLAPIPIITFNHGGDHEIYRAAAEFISPQGQRELAAQRTMMRWSSTVLTPSKTAMHFLDRDFGADLKKDLLREPLTPGTDSPPNLEAARFVLLGRISFAKGLDNVVHFLNVFQNMSAINEIVFIGRLIDTPFRTCEAREYISKRLSKGLKNKLHILGELPRSEMRGLLEGGGFSLNFSRSETFNYAFLEQLSYGLMPFTKAGSAMAEFYPEELKDLLLPANFDLTQLPHIHARLSKDPAEILGLIRHKANSMTDPRVFVDGYSQIVARLRKEQSPAPRKAVKSRRWFASDVSVLIPSFNPNESIFDTVRSIKEQKGLPPAIIVGDDGSDSEHSLAILDKLRLDPEVKVVRFEANEGLCATRNRLVALCTTPLAIFLDDDDRLAESYVCSVLDAANDSPIGPAAVVTWRQNYGANSDLIINYNLEDQTILYDNDLRMTALIRLDVLNDLGFSPDMRNGEADDWDFWLRFKLAGFTAVCVPEPLFLYNIRVGSMSWPWSSGQAALTADLISKNFESFLEQKALPMNVIYDLVLSRHQLGLMRSAFEHGGSRRSREKYIGLVRSAYPLRGAVLALVYRLITAVAKRLVLRMQAAQKGSK